MPLFPSPYGDYLTASLWRLPDSELDFAVSRALARAERHFWGARTEEIESQHAQTLHRHCPDELGGAPSPAPREAAPAEPP